MYRVDQLTTCIVLSQGYFEQCSLISNNDGYKVLLTSNNIVRKGFLTILFV